MSKKVLLGMSGGVDSSVSAALLLESGYEVIGAFMKNWSGSVCYYKGTKKTEIGEARDECGWKAEQRDAQRVAAKLGIPFVTFDFEQEYRRDVVEHMFKEFEAGRTPNPDVMCNRFIKFDRFVKEADRLGCNFIATGHYARVVAFPPYNLQSTTYNLLSGTDKNKDQSYFLWAINPAILSRVLFPIGEMTKPEVRAKAREFNLEVADKKDSTGICFVGEVEMREFLQERIPKNPGNVVSTNGKIVGRHEGIAFYTIGQRHGLNISSGEPLYVVEKRPQTKELVVSSNFHPSLFKSELTASQLNWFRIPSVDFFCEARIRYRQPLQRCKVEFLNRESVCVIFDQPQRAVTPGQSVVFYDREIVIGGGVID